VAVGIPAECIRRRPDIRQAERELAGRIDRYRTRALEKGRQLTFEEAASEWIGKFSKFLPT